MALRYNMLHGIYTDMAAIEFDLKCIFKGLDKYQRVLVAVDWINNQSLLKIDKLARSKYGSDVQSPIKPYFAVLKCHDFNLFDDDDLELGQGLRLRLRIRGYNYSGNKGFTLQIVKVYNT